jgi:serine---pyruvate transaminase
MGGIISMKNRLFTPGPTPVPASVMLRMAEPLIHHRHPEFRAMFHRVNENLRYVFQTEQPVVTLNCSGTGAMEAVFVNLFSPGETVIAVNGGKFGERWVQMPRVFGIHSVELTVPWGNAIEPAAVAEALRVHPETKGVILTHSETSTGAATDLREIARTIRQHSDALVCVDGITSVGAHEMRFDEWGIDACVTGSQKGLMIPPGLAFVALSKRAQEAIERSTMPRFYFDLRRALRAVGTDDTPWTPAISLVSGLDTALQMIRSEGIENVWSRHRRLATGLRAGITALGLKLFSDTPSYAVTPIWLPEGIVWKEFSNALKLDNGITVAGGQGDFTGKIFRIAHLGYSDELDMVTVVAALERGLIKCGFPLVPGSGVAAAQKVLLEQV